MKIFQGTSISKGIAIGIITIFQNTPYEIYKQNISNVDDELHRYNEAKKLTVQQLSELYSKAVTESGEKNASLFNVHAMMLEDKAFTDSVYEIIKNQKLNAEFAVSTTCDQFMAMFDGLEDEYFRARAMDIKDVSERLIRILSGTKSELNHFYQSSILVTEDLSPSETIGIDKKSINAFVVQKGALNSHTSILARSMNIPAITGITPQKEWNGKLAIVDANEGKLILDPDNETLNEIREKQKKEIKYQEQLQNLVGKEDITLDGKSIHLYANIEKVSDVEAVLSQDAKGIGLFRSEFLYLGREDYPTEEEQFLAYKEVAQRMKGKPVIIRTLDIGTDKKEDYFELEHEENPALGYRAIRICLDRIDIFKTQLRAILRASMYGDISIMFPMIISVEELHKIYEIFEEVQKELTDQKLDFRAIKRGIMIETPAAVMISDLLAKEVDFLSIGTNDLTQYTLAVDRQNAKLDALYNDKHTAILRMIQMVIDHGHKENCQVGICGELAADESVTEQLIKMGIDEFSVSPSYVLPIRNIIRTTVS